jgi:hypothetical protein
MAGSGSVNEEPSWWRNAMAALIDRGKSHRITAVSSIPFISRLGGIAGLLGVALGLMLGLDLLNLAPKIAMVLQGLPNLAVTPGSRPRGQSLGIPGVGRSHSGLVDHHPL